VNADAAVIAQAAINLFIGRPPSADLACLPQSDSRFAKVLDNPSTAIANLAVAIAIGFLILFVASLMFS
jgi:hypothetical protein